MLFCDAVVSVIDGAADLILNDSRFSEFFCAFWSTSRERIGRGNCEGSRTHFGYIILCVNWNSAGSIGSS